MRYIAFLTIIVFLISCDERIELNPVKNFNSNIVLSSFLDNKSDSISVKISQTYPAYKRTPKEIKLAFVEFINESINKVVYLQKYDNSIWSAGVPDLVSGNVCRLNIIGENSETIYSAIDTIPQEITIGVITHSYIISSEGKPAVSVSISFDGSITKNISYYEILAYKSNPDTFYIDNINRQQAYLTTQDYRVTSEDYYPALINFTKDTPSSLLFNSRDNKISVSFSYNAGISYSYYGIKSLPHKLKVEVRRVSYAYYKYKTSLYKQQSDIKGDILFGLPSLANVYSNVENGYGVFACYNATDTIIDIEEYILEK